MMNKTFEGRPLGLAMQSNRNVVIFVSLLLQLLMVGATAAPLADQVNPMGNYDKMNYDLQQELYDSSVDTLLPVIFQLNSPVTDADLAQFEEFGATVFGHAPLVDGGLIEAKAEDVRRISNWDRIEYLELDKELDFFYLPPEWGGDPTDPSAMMHETTHVVKATDTWDRVIVSPDGVVQYDVDLAFTEWDGDGTAIVDLDTGVDAGHPRLRLS